MTPHFLAAFFMMQWVSGNLNFPLSCTLLQSHFTILRLNSAQCLAAQYIRLIVKIPMGSSAFWCGPWLQDSSAGYRINIPRFCWSLGSPGQWLAICTQNYFNNLNALYCFSVHTGTIRSVSFSANGRILATASDDGTVKILDVCEGRPAYTLRGHKVLLIICHACLWFF